MNLPGNVFGSAISPARGEIWQARLEPTEGSEQGKARPIVILSVVGVGRPSIRVCVPFMGFQPAHVGRLWLVVVAPSAGNGLEKLSTVDAMQVRALDMRRFERQIGTLEPVYVQALADAVALRLGHSPTTTAPPQPST